MEPMKVKFLDWECGVVFDRYQADDSIAILLVDIEDGSPVADASVCLYPSASPPSTDCDDNVPDSVFIKDYSENEGMVDALTSAGVIYPGPITTVQSGFVQISAYQLTPEAFALAMGDEPGEAQTEAPQAATEGRMTVTLAHAPNPDLADKGGYWSAPVQSGTTQTLAVDSIEEAQDTCRRYIDGNRLGGGNWTGGLVRDPEGEILGKVAYNGRWFPVEPEANLENDLELPPNPGSGTQPGPGQ